ncbi:MAG: tyrosine-type recombinase/integrase [bacterium]
MNTNSRTHLLAEPLDPTKWESAMQAFLAEKYRRTGSMRTVESYSRILNAFYGGVHKTPDQVVTAEAMAFCFGRGVSGKEPAALTVGSRIAAISSFFRFLIRMDLMTSNPCERLERPKHTPAPARGLSGEDVRRLLAVIPDDIGGRRDRAIILTLVLSGRRRSEVLNLKAGDIEWDGERAYYSYRGKGGKHGRRELPRPAFDAIQRTVQDCGKRLERMAPEESLWQAGAKPEGVSQPVAYARFKRYLANAELPSSGFHVLRHSAAKLRRDAGDSVEKVSQFLDHSSLAVTSVYLRRLEVAEDASWWKVAEAIGV